MITHCECGCGNPAPISTHSRPERGQRKGEPVRFIKGHNNGWSHTAETRRRIGEAVRKRVVSDATREKLSASKRGSKNPGWKGGTFTSKGYRWIRVGVDHPMAYESGYVLEHRLVAAAAIGRMLRRDEHVHHLDFDSLNNSPENLLILSGSQHSRLHRLIDSSGVAPREALDQVLGGTD